MEVSPRRVGGRLDRLGVVLSSLCLVHCMLGLVLVAGLGLGGAFLMDPAIHRFGLVLATIIAGMGIGAGALRHGRRGPLMVAATGLGFMAAAIGVGHGVGEAVLTVIGVVLVATGHILNLRCL